MGIIGAILGVIIGLFVLAWTQGLFGGGTDKVDEVQTLALIGETRGNVKEGFFGMPSYPAGDLVPRLRSMGKIPAGADTGTGMESRYGPMTVTGNGRLFAIGLTDLSGAACYNLGKRFARGAGDSGVVNVQAGTTAIAQGSIQRASGSLLTEADIDTACGAADARGRILTITFR